MRENPRVNDATLGAWLEQGSNPDFTKVADHKIRWLLVNPRPHPNPAAPLPVNVLNTIRTFSTGTTLGPIKAGIYVGRAWTDNASPQQLAAIVSNWITATQLKSGEPVMVNLEPIDKVFTRDFITSYRKLRPWRPTSIAVGYGQGALVPMEDLARDGMHVYVELYYGDMSPANAAVGILDLLRVPGAVAGTLHPFYAGDNLPADRVDDGCVFTLGRIP